MSTVQELLAQKAALDVQIKQAKAEAFAGVVAAVESLCVEHGFGLDEMAAALLTKHKKRLPRPGKKPVHAANFRNKMTGATWSGIGRRPRWFSDMSNVETL